MAKLRLQIQAEQKSAYERAAAAHATTHAWAVEAIKRALDHDVPAYRAPEVDALWLPSRTRDTAVNLALLLPDALAEEVDAAITCGQSRAGWLILVLDAAAGISALPSQLERARGKI